MNSMKTLVVMGLLAAAGYYTYMYMGQKPETTSADAQAFPNSPSVQIPGPNSPPSQLAGATPTGPASAPATLLSAGSPPPLSANSSPFLSPSGLTAGSPASSNAPPAGAGVTLLNPPGQTNIPNATPASSAAGSAPVLLGSPTAAQTPAATGYPPSNAAPSSSPAATSADGMFQSKFAEFMQAVHKKLDEGRLSEAHLALSSLYDNPDLPQAQARQVTELLDQLAGTVIYSRQHLLEQPYLVRPGDTLEQVADKYNVPPVLLARINGIREGMPLEPGQELKVVRGPFNAVIRLDKHELTLMVDGRYAGRFPIGVGCDQPKLEGTYIVREKNANPQYHGPDGITVPGGDPRNPLGKFWIGLSNNIGLHGTVDPQNIGRDDNRGTICLGDRDIDDIYGILSVGSRVVIQR
ncbi:MAG: L,D-transpeptidase family protein [Thermoguttaceae bacterium]